MLQLFQGMDEDEEEVVPLPNVNAGILKKVVVVLKILISFALSLWNQASAVLGHFSLVIFKRESSVTRFGEILPLWKDFKTVWQSLKSLFSILKNCKPT